MGSKQILIVGAGFAGATIAYELAINGYNVTVIDKRDHIGGNAYDYVNHHGIRIHKYGAHIFHTKNKKVFDWLSQFTEWIEYKHKVVAKLPNDDFIVFPPTKDFSNSVGIEYIRKVLYIPYTKKMWGMSIDEIDSSVINRVPVREDNGDLYFPNDEYQYLPKNGYSSIFSEILNHKNITVKLNTQFDKKMEDDYYHVFNSMPIDEYYDYKYGELPYRSILFDHADYKVEKLSNHPVINFTDDGPYTRVIEWKNFPNHGNNKETTTVTKEIPCDYKENHMERYYPVKDAKGLNRRIYDDYKKISNDKVTFIGRCGMYVYIDMDQAISSSLSIANKFLIKESICQMEVKEVIPDLLV